MLDNDYEKCNGEPNIYIKVSESKLLIVVLFVDDFIFSGNNDLVIVVFKKIMKNQFEMINLGLFTYFLGIEVKQIENGIIIAQAKYALNFLKRFNM